MKKNRFKILFAYRNIKANKKSSLVIILTLSLVFCLSMLLLGMKSTFTKVFEYEAVNKYNQIDIVITFDEYSSSRLVSKRDITEKYDEQVFYSMSFLNFSVLTETDEVFYTQMMSSVSHEFEYLVDKDVLIKPGEIIITESLSSTYNLEIGDTLTLHIIDKTVEYTVGDIFEDAGLFSGLTFYVEKEELMEAVYGITLTNLGNTLYIDLDEGYEVDDVIDLFKADDEFTGYYIFETIDWDYIETRAMDLVSMMLALGLIIVFAVILVLDSLFPIISKDIRHQQGVVSVLGGEKKLIWHVNLIQWLLYASISFVIGCILTLFITNYGLYTYGITGFIPLKIGPLSISLLFVLAYIIIRAYIAYHREYQDSSISLSKNKRFKKYKTKEVYIVLALVLLVLEYVFEFFNSGIHSLIIVCLTLYLAFNIASYILVVFSNIFGKKRKKSLFNLFQLKYLKTDKHVHLSLRVLMISLFALVVLFSLRLFMDQQIDDFYDLMDFDLAVANINDYDSTLIDEIEMYDIESADQAVFYQRINIDFDDENSQPCRFFVSMERDALFLYFGLEEIDFDESYLDNEVAYVVLPKSHQLVYDLEIGDIVSLDLNYSLEEIEMEVAGFIDTDLDNLVYSNILFVDQYEDIAETNFILINTNNKDMVFNQLVSDYSQRMYYIMDPNVYFVDLISSVESITNFFSVLTLYMILCFVIVIFNNTLLVFFGIKNDLAKVKVLGVSKGEFIISLLKEYLTLIVLVLGIGWLEVLVLSENLKYVVLLTNYYKDISSTPLTNLYSCAIVGCVLLLSYLYYLHNINKIEIIEEIKIY